LSTPLYKPQADRLVRALGKSLVTADLIQIWSLKSSPITREDGLDEARVLGNPKP
jgi:hypothetical protein